MESNSARCPICLSGRTNAISGPYFLCHACGNAFNESYAPKVYNDNYFLDEYQRQYGKTYIEDYETIRAASKKRLQNIIKLLPYNIDLPSLSLIDIGSAAGFFLKCAQDSGITDVSGIEISGYASRYCSEQFTIPVIQSSFDDVKLERAYDIITAWYFIEHCRDPRSTIEKMCGALKPGGVLAFSGPSIFGPLFVFNRKEWTRAHPEDHRVDFSPGGANYILKQYGFSKIIVRPSGIHPERVINEQSPVYRTFSRLYGAFSRITAFSDTIEVYAVRKK